MFGIPLCKTEMGSKQNVAYELTLNTFLYTKVSRPPPPFVCQGSMTALEMWHLARVRRKRFLVAAAKMLVTL